MKINKYIKAPVAVLLFLTSISLEAQTRVTNGTKVIVVINKQSNAIINIELFDTANAEENISKKHPESIFILGLFKGSYQLDDKIVKPEKGAELTIYTDKILFNKTVRINEKEFDTEMINGKIMSKKKGELIIKLL